MKSKKIYPYLFLVLISIVVFSIRKCNSSADVSKTKEIKSQIGLNRNPSHINYSKHATCRMACREIDETEIKDIIKNGKINYQKSDLQKSDCSKRYAVEGYGKDKQHIRIIAVPCSSELTIVTCIDIDKDWECHCEGDE